MDLVVVAGAGTSVSGSVSSMMVSCTGADGRVGGIKPERGILGGLVLDVVSCPFIRIVSIETGRRALPGDAERETDGRLDR